MKYEDLFKEIAKEIELRSGEIADTPRKIAAMQSAVFYGNITLYNKEAAPGSTEMINHRIFMARARSFYLRKGFDLSIRQTDAIRSQEEHEVLHLRALLRRI